MEDKTIPSMIYADEMFLREPAEITPDPVWTGFRSEWKARPMTERLQKASSTLSRGPSPTGTAG
jgi:hypothetical protein